jgi:hypothetical protein
MVKLVFNPKNESSKQVTVSSKTSKKIEKGETKTNLNPFKFITETETNLIKNNETNLFKNNEINLFKNNLLSCKNLVGLENCYYILNEWYNNGTKNLLLIGPTGCGKSTLIELFCYEENIKLLNIKTNDNKSKRDLLKDIDLFMEYSGDFFFRKSDQKKLLLIDDYQNGANDIFNITDIIALAEKKIKILVISSDSRGTKLSDLKKSFETYYINEIPGYLIKNWIISLKTNLNVKQIDILVKKCKSDKRLILNTLEFINNNHDNSFLQFLESYYKDDDINIFEYIKKIFDNIEPLDINTYFKIYDNDGYLLANLVHENYLDYNQDIHSIANAAEAISSGEILFSDTYETNKSFLPDLHCLHSIIIPSYCSRSPTNYKSIPRSSVINNRFNILLNNKKIIQRINGLKNVLDIYDIYIIKKILNQELIKAKTFIKPKIDFIKNVLSSLDNNIENLELIYKHFNEFKAITEKEVKTKNFTLKFKEKLKSI